VPPFSTKKNTKNKRIALDEIDEYDEGNECE